jgi:hypothetical protein
MVDSRGTRGVVGPFEGGHVVGASLIFNLEGRLVVYDCLRTENYAIIFPDYLYGLQWNRTRLMYPLVQLIMTYAIVEGLE